MEIPKEKLDEIKEESYLEGERAVFRQQLSNALKGLNYDKKFTKERLIKEREEYIASLRSICAKYGDNDWDDDLYLNDVINKHLANYLNEQWKERII